MMEMLWTDLEEYDKLKFSDSYVSYLSLWDTSLKVKNELLIIDKIFLTHPDRIDIYFKNKFGAYKLNRNGKEFYLNIDVFEIVELGDK